MAYNKGGAPGVIHLKYIAIIMAKNSNIDKVMRNAKDLYIV